MTKWLVVIAVVVMVCCLYFIANDRRILIKETLIRPGQTYLVEDYGDLGKSEAPSLVCEYFNGRRLLTTVFWYAPNNFMGRDSCPFFN